MYRIFSFPIKHNLWNNFFPIIKSIHQLKTKKCNPFVQQHHIVVTHFGSNRRNWNSRRSLRTRTLHFSTLFNLNRSKLYFPGLLFPSLDKYRKRGFLFEARGANTNNKNNAPGISCCVLHIVPHNTSTKKEEHARRRLLLRHCHDMRTNNDDVVD